ncbi:MAG: beta-N-acetylhexosaminidase [Kiritimatiellae bacterium]|nr:beta-N-acetylhexosaminidase [Kiritimatiellia bacterium]
MFAVRSYMLDISRDKVPTMGTLKRLVEILEKFNYNQLQLYTEHTFAYSKHEAVWKDASPMTAQEIRELDLFCAMHGIDLVPNQNSFGHLERWLVKPEYNHLAELPHGGAPLPWGGFKKDPTTLCPTDPASLEFLAGLYDELLPNFESRLFNIGCDETFDLLGEGRSAAAVKEKGEGRVYLDFLLKVAELVRKRGKRPMFWGDVILRHPELVPELPKDLVALDWGYEGNHPFMDEAAKFAAAGLDFYVCPGTSSWNSLAGRVENMRENMIVAERAGHLHGAKGFMVTDWGDGGHWQPLAASLPGLILGGNLAYSGASAAKMDLEDALNAVMGVPLGGTLLRLGTLYLRGGALRANASELFRILANDRGYSRHPGLTDHILTEISAIAEGCRHDAARFAGGAYPNVWAQEIMYMANLVDAACNRRDEKRLRFLREEHGRVWRLRNREGGRADSLAKLPRF